MSRLHSKSSSLWKCVLKWKIRHDKMIIKIGIWFTPLPLAKHTLFSLGYIWSQFSQLAVYEDMYFWMQFCFRNKVCGIIEAPYIIRRSKVVSRPVQSGLGFHLFSVSQLCSIVEQSWLMNYILAAICLSPTDSAGNKQIFFPHLAVCNYCVLVYNSTEVLAGEWTQVCNLHFFLLLFLHSCIILKVWKQFPWCFSVF